MKSCSRYEPWQRVLPAYHKETEYNVEYLQDGKWCNERIKWLCCKVPKDFRPEKAMDTGTNLIYRYFVSFDVISYNYWINVTKSWQWLLTNCCGKNDKASQMIFYEFSHFLLFILLKDIEIAGLFRSRRVLRTCCNCRWLTEQAIVYWYLYKAFSFRTWRELTSRQKWIMIFLGRSRNILQLQFGEECKL